MQIINNKPFLPLPTAFHSQFPCTGMSQTEAHHLKIHQQTEVYKLKPLKIMIKSRNPQARKAKILIPNQQTHHLKIKTIFRPSNPLSLGSRDACNKCSTFQTKQNLHLHHNKYSNCHLEQRKTQS